MAAVRIENVDRGVVLAGRAVVARGFWERGRGLMGRRGLGAGEGLVLAPCGSIHTFGMRFSIDALHVDAEGRCLAVATALRPGRLGPLRRGVRAVIELPAGAAGPTRPGDLIRWAPVPSEAAAGSAAGEHGGQEA